MKIYLIPIKMESRITLLTPIRSMAPHSIHNREFLTYDVKVKGQITISRTVRIYYLMKDLRNLDKCQVNM